MLAAFFGIKPEKTSSAQPRDFFSDGSTLAPPSQPLMTELPPPSPPKNQDKAIEELMRLFPGGALAA